MHDTQSHSRRDFLNTALTAGAAAAGASAGAFALAPHARAQPAPAPPGGRTFAPPRAPVVIASGNGLLTVQRAREMLTAPAPSDPLDAVVEGVRIVEDDPEDMTVGLGGLPNEEGVVELDASVMHGPTHRAGAVAALRNVKNAAAVAREVARRTDHVLIVGEGALKFALRMGFREENLLTEKARLEWLKWRSTLNREDDWLAEDEFDLPTAPASATRRSSMRDTGGAGSFAGAQARDSHLESRRGALFTEGTIHCAAVTPAGDVGSVTTTSGLSWKLPGRVGDSPIIGAGNYCDNEIGAAGATGRGEAVIQVCGAHTAVTRMAMGDDPTEACLVVLRKIAACTRLKRLLHADGHPNFNVTMYALRRDGAFGSASLREGGTFAIADAAGGRVEKSAFLFPKM